MISPSVIACVDCIHYIRTWKMIFHGTYARCKAEYTPEVDLVSGRISNSDPLKLPRCHNQRTEINYDNETTNVCGVHGLLWAPREESPEATMLLLKRTEQK
jgi:hypothetical protein